jgi:hypothetical protein
VNCAGFVMIIQGFFPDKSLFMRALEKCMMNNPCDISGLQVIPIRL